MNTRLQVEHPVTEMITGLDLVEWQLRIAAGEPLPLPQDEITANGHAIEARIYAEDADKGFLPSIGRITRWDEPPASDGVRVDTGFRAGDTITPYYDALLAKLIVWDTDRAQALDRMAQALDAFEIAGVTTNLEFLEALVSHPYVRSGEIDTGFIERELATLTAARPLSAQEMAAASAAVLVREQGDHDPAADPAPSPWNRADGWMMAGLRRRRLSFRRGAARHDAVIGYGRGGLTMEYGEDERSAARTPRAPAAGSRCPSATSKIRSRPRGPAAISSSARRMDAAGCTGSIRSPRSWVRPMRRAGWWRRCPAR